MARVVTYHREVWPNVVVELAHHWPNHWREVALHQDHIQLEPDYQSYERMHAAGELEVVAARCEGHLVGYAVVVVKRHLHYRSSLTGFYDLYYLKPTYRDGWAGIKLFRVTEQLLKARGCDRIFLGTKVHKDYSKIFEFLGYEPTETVFCKLIKE